MKITKDQKIKLIYKLRDFMNRNLVGGHRWEVDHIIPRAKKGEHKLENLQIISKRENRRKGCKSKYKIKGTIIRGVDLLKLIKWLACEGDGNG